jgi:hypothetical protein
MKPNYYISLTHYYGDIVRKLFFAAAILMLFGLPFFSERVPVPTIWSLVAIVTIGFLAGLTNPVKSFPAWVNTIVSGIAVIIFEAFAVMTYRDIGPDVLFLANQALAILFLIALYFSTKTLRAMVLEQNN